MRVLVAVGRSASPERVAGAHVGSIKFINGDNAPTATTVQPSCPGGHSRGHRALYLGRDESDHPRPTDCHDDVVHSQSVEDRMAKPNRTSKPKTPPPSKIINRGTGGPNAGHGEGNAHAGKGNPHGHGKRRGS